MRFSRLLAVVTVLGLLSLVPAANALTVNATAPTEPLPNAGTVTIDVRVDAACREILEENPSGGAMTLKLIVSSTVDWIEATGGEIQWTSEQCDPSSLPGAAGCTAPECAQGYPTATTSGTITLTPTNIAPALETAEIVIEVENHDGVVTFPVTVAHFAEFAASSDRTTVKAGLAEKQPLNVTLDVNTNAVSTATFNVTEAPKYGMLRGLDNAALTPNIATLFEHHAGFFVWSDGGPDAGQPLSMVVPLQYESAAGVWGPDRATIDVRMYADKDPTLMSDPVTLSWTFEPTVTEQPGGNAPGLDLFVIVFAVVGVLFVRTRRNA
ncbi:MAG TPA: hypothetical protein VGB18_01990 [Candidatus Thermoplasmatota archaeon]